MTLRTLKALNTMDGLLCMLPTYEAYFVTPKGESDSFEVEALSRKEAEQTAKEICRARGVVFINLI